MDCNYYSVCDCNQYIKRGDTCLFKHGVYLYFEKLRREANQLAACGNPLPMLEIGDPAFGVADEGWYLRGLSFIDGPDGFP
jgi:hypothetical protein